MFIVYWLFGLFTAIVSLSLHEVGLRRASNVAYYVGFALVVLLAFVAGEFNATD